MISDTIHSIIITTMWDVTQLSYRDNELHSLSEIWNREKTGKYWQSGRIW